jgi:tRNA threonylcarbamoyladenosine biosynthesis protein TsaE
MFEIGITDLQGTERLAGKLADLLRAGDCVIFSGPLGAGKTRFVQAICQAWGVTQDVTSPTFPILNMYRADNFSVLHIDAYRIESIKEFRDLGLEEYFDEGVALIEWGEKFAQEFPDRLEIAIDFSGDEGRRFRFHPVGVWTTRIAAGVLI